jgi:uncharacterized membrane-anchored protein
MTTARPWQDGPLPAHRYAASKVPVITAYFWIIKVLTTAMGEATSDFLAHNFNPYIVVPLGGVALVITLIIQLSTPRYITAVYWFTCVMVAIVGTMFADATHIQFHVPYYQTSALFAVALAVIFVLWYRSERTLSIHSIYTRRREMFYWATVLATFALGTALGDFTARSLHEGFLGAGIMFAILIMIPAVAHWKLGMNAIFAFWFAYVLTRPLGASFADYMDMPKFVGGLALGQGHVAIGLTIPIILLVAYLGLSRKDVEEQISPAATGGGKHRQSAAVAEKPARAPATNQAQAYAGEAAPYAGQVGPYAGQAGPYAGQAQMYRDQPPRHEDQAHMQGGGAPPYPDQALMHGGEAPPYPDQPQRYAERRPDRDW